MQRTSTISIDNPGRGDCGIYAFANSLIEIIQQDPNSPEAEHIVRQLIAYSPNKEQKTNPAHMSELKNALLKTPYITTLGSTIKVNLPVGDKVSAGGYSLDEYLVKRLRVIAADAFFNTYQKKKNELLKFKETYSTNKNEAIQILSKEHTVLFQYVKQKAVEYMCDDKNDAQLECAENQNKSKRLTKAQECREQGENIDDQIMDSKEAKTYLDNAIMAKVKAFKIQRQRDFKENNNLEFLRCYAEERIIDEFLNVDGSYNQENIAYGSFNSLMLIPALTISLQEELKDTPSEQTTPSFEGYRTQINAKTAENNSYGLLKDSVIVSEALMYFNAIRRYGALQQSSGIFSHMPDFEEWVKKHIKISKEVSPEAAEREFINNFFQNENSVYHSALKNAMSALKQSSYDRGGVEVTWIDDVLLRTMANEVFRGCLQFTVTN